LLLALLAGAVYVALGAIALCVGLVYIVMGRRLPAIGSHDVAGRSERSRDAPRQPPARDLAAAPPPDYASSPK
jgi:hypothetical protein